MEVNNIKFIMKFYIDTCIWRDYFEDRKDKFRPLGEWAFHLIKYAIKNNISILYSDLIIRELKDNEELIAYITTGEDSFLKIDISEFQAKEAHNLSKRLKIPFQDVLHAILARDNEAILITRDKHFEMLDIVEVKKPEDLI